jgi:hypothetical protein
MAFRGALAGDHGVGEVPRGDRRDHADRLLDDDDALVRLVLRDGVAVDPLGLLGEPLDKARAVDDLAAGLGQGLALLHGHEDGEILLVRHHQVVPLAQDVGALLAGLGAPVGPGPVRRIDGAPGLGGAQLGDRAQHLAGRRIGHVDGLAGLGVDPGAVDIGLLAEQAHIGEARRAVAGDRVDFCGHGFALPYRFLNSCHG